MSRAPQLSQVAENLSLRRLGLALLMAAAAAGVCYLFLAGPANAVLDLGTLRRYKYTRWFYDSFQPPGEGQLVLGLGDSVTMSGFNGDAFEAAAGPGWTAYNLATPAKTFPEYLFDLAEPAVAGAHLVVFVTPSALFDPGYSRIEPRKAQLTLVLGGRVEPELWQGLAELLPDAGSGEVLRPRFTAVLDSRWRIEDSLAWQIRLMNPGERESQMVRNLLGRFSSDLKYPAWEGRADASELAAELDVLARSIPRLYTPETAVDPQCAAAFQYVVAQALKRCRSLTLVAAPVHHDVRHVLGDARIASFREMVMSQGQAGARVLDLTEFLTDEEFRDYVHISDQASLRVTREIAAVLAQPPGPGAG